MIAHSSKPKRPNQNPKVTLKPETKRLLDGLFPSSMTYDQKIRESINLIPTKVKQLLKDTKRFNDDTGIMFANIVKDKLNSGATFKNKR